MTRVRELDRGRETILRPAIRTVRAILAAIAVALVLAPGASAHHASGPCDFHRHGGHTVRQHSRAQIRCAVTRWPVPGGEDVALCIAKRESRLLPWAESDDELNKGLFQLHVRYWHGNYEAYARPAWELPKRILSGRTNAIVSIRMAHDIGWAPWGGRTCS